eukprot:TRINITY_DN30391_c0_g1_i1.p8 TRINITY_DN30391_c0_g1~~TRINITY_DN30391_c0_g1_i1.p8  ORF type:complete len:101 (+),score=12.55 TRINITY_DN30391_c0_g1_i1:85-387(+)
MGCGGSTHAAEGTSPRESNHIAVGQKYATATAGSDAQPPKPKPKPPKCPRCGGRGLFCTKTGEPHTHVEEDEDMTRSLSSFSWPASPQRGHADAASPRSA